MTRVALPAGRRIGAVALGVVVLLAASFIGLVIASFVGVSLRLEGVARGVLNALAVVAAVGVAGRLLTTRVLPPLAPDYERLDLADARRVTWTAAAVLGGVLLVVLPLTAPSDVGALAWIPGPLLTLSAVAGTLIGPAPHA